VVVVTQRVERVELPIEVEDFLMHLLVEKGRATLTLDAYRRDLRRYVAFLASERDGATVATATPADVAAFATSLRSAGLAASSTTRTLVAVRTMHRWLAAEGLRADDPAVRVEAPRLADALPKALSEEQVMALLDSLEDEVVALQRGGGGAGASARGDQGSPDPRALAFAVRDRALFETLYGTGARVSEVCGLGFGDVDLDGALLRVVGKRSKERVVPLGSHAVRTLREWFDDGRPRLVPREWRRRDDADAVFLGARGTRLTRQAVWQLLQQHGLRAGVPVQQLSPHVLRHSCATHLLDHGADIRSVQELLGHASIGTTQRYTKVATERLWQAYLAAHPRAGARRAGAPQ